MITVSDEAWNRATDVVASEFNALPRHFFDKIAALVSEIKLLKSALFELTRKADGQMVCLACDGACCNSGSYHFTVTDLLAYLSDGKELFTPDFFNCRCPFLSGSGCMMEPEYRPFNCITFNCENLEKLLPRNELVEFYENEKKLRSRYSAIEKLFDNRFSYGLLSNYERSLAVSGGMLFQYVTKTKAFRGGE